MSEKSLLDRNSELEDEVKDVTATTRTRMRWLETVADMAKQRVEKLFRDLQGSAPLMVGGGVGDGEGKGEKVWQFSSWGSL